MRRLDIAGGWYGEALPGGEYAVTVGHTVQTHLGSWPLDDPSDTLLFTRCRAVGGFQAAGQSHSGRGNLIVDPGPSWRVFGPSYGVSPVIYDPSGNLHANSGTAGSQGWRFWGPSGPVSGDATYVDPSKPIWEWTAHGDVTIGQGATSAIAIYRGKRLILEPGDCRFIRFNRDGQSLAVTIVKMPESRTVILWLTPDELLEFPEEAAVIQPGPRPELPPRPEPQMPSVPVDQVARALQILEELPIRAGEPPLPYVRAVAEILGYPWGLNGKRGNPNDLSGDILAYDFPGAQPQLYDVLRDGGGENGKVWQELEYPQSAGAVFVRVGAAPQPEPRPEIPEEPRPGTPDTLQEVLQELRKLNKHLGVK